VPGEKKKKKKLLGSFFKGKKRNYAQKGPKKREAKTVVQKESVYTKPVDEGTKDPGRGNPNRRKRREVRKGKLAKKGKRKKVSFHERKV